jgi:hypothetical protein
MLPLQGAPTVEAIWLQRCDQPSAKNGGLNFTSVWFLSVTRPLSGTSKNQSGLFANYFKNKI